jgi:DNA-binding transcriptional MerR regulator
MVKRRKNCRPIKLISAKEITRKYKISYQTVNHYTDFGLLTLVLKQGNVRFYDECEVRSRLVRITKLAREGYSLRLIRKKLLGI